MPNIFSVESMSRYGAKCPGFREAWHQLQCLIDVGRYDDRVLAELVDYVIDQAKKKKRIQQTRKRSAK